MKRVFLVFLTLIVFVSVAIAENEHWYHPKYIRTYIQPYHKNTIMMQQAFQRWTKVTNKKVIFMMNSNRKAADIEVYFVDKISNCTSDKAIGCTQNSFVPNGKYAHATIWIADKTQDDRELSRDEVFTTMLHEIGHAIGLDHVDNPESVMCPTVDVIQEISKEDIDRVNELYK